MTTTTTTARWVLLDTHAPGEDDCWYALVQVDPAKVEQALAGMGRLRAEGVELSRMDLDWPVWWFKGEELRPPATRRLGVELDALETFALLDPKVAARLSCRSGERTECDAAVLTHVAGMSPCIHWECYPKHADLKVETQFLDWRTLRAALDTKPARVAS
jgi:hypothetical protein